MDITETLDINGTTVVECDEHEQAEEETIQVMETSVVSVEAAGGGESDYYGSYCTPSTAQSLQKGATQTAQLPVAGGAVAKLRAAGDIFFPSTTDGGRKSFEATNLTHEAAQDNCANIAVGLGGAAQDLETRYITASLDDGSQLTLASKPTHGALIQNGIFVSPIFKLNAMPRADSTSL